MKLFVYKLTKGSESFSIGLVAQSGSTAKEAIKNQLGDEFSILYIDTYDHYLITQQNYQSPTEYVEIVSEDQKSGIIETTE